ncbi:hypothetical protein [Natronolimnobius sp. AArcel1]|uniref:DUF7287 family protein n=1 Tax=Natronolimnobius sp. AArcel1 TaxID=1679093 RepID=UPI0019D091B9|nr:hypothetical protein [Natronolimnobius sp. AArcel1]
MFRDRFDTRDETTDRPSERSRTVTISSPLERDRDRGQTTQDFAVGIGIFILAVAFVFSFLPSIVTPYDSSIGGAETAQADRISDKALDNLSTGADPNEIDADALEEFEDEHDMVKAFGLRTANSGNNIDRLNVTVQELDSDDDEWSFGDTYDEDQPAASSARIVSVDDDDEDAYRLIVRVW